MDRVFEAPETNSAEYQANHKRVRAARGQARGFACISCGRTAEHWAWRHGEDPSIPANYDPMCRSCHQDYDLPDWLAEERRLERERVEKTNAYKGWTPERREAQRQRMLAKWSSPGAKEKQAERAKADQPWLGRRPRKGGGLR